MKRFVTLLMLSLFAFASAYAQTVSVDDIYSNQGSEITIPIKINDATSTAFTSGQFVLEYDTSIVEILSVAVGSVVSDPNAQLINNNTVRAPGIGEYRVAISTTVPFTKGEGTLAVLTARVKNYGQSNLTLVNTLLNTGAPASVQNGLLNTSIPITISGPERLDQGTSGTYSVSVGDLNARNITSFQFTIGFDSNLLNVGNITNGAILDGLSTESSVLGSAVRVAYGSQTALAGNGVLFTFEATANSTNTGTSVFNFSNVLFNAGTANGENTNVVTTPAFGVMVQDYVFVTLEGNSLSRTLGGTSAVDIVASDLTGEEVSSFQFVLDYPETDVAIDSVVFLTDLNANQTGQSFDVNGVINGAAASQTLYAGAGSLARVYVRNLTKGTHRLAFNSFTINTGTPIASTSTIDLIVNNTAPTAPMILVPGAGDTVMVAGLPTSTIVPAWSAATDTEMDTLNYTWDLATSMAFDTILLSVNTMADTSVTLTNAAVEALLVANGITVGNSITLYHRATAKDGDSMTAGAGSAATFTLGVVNTPPTATSILVPADGDTVNVNGLPTGSIVPAWSASSDADMDTLNYTWQLAADTNFTTVLLSVPVMTDTSITLSVGAVRDLLEANGVMQGGSITLYHRANTNDGNVVVNGNRAAATFSLGVVNTPPTATSILAPANGDTVNVVGLPTATISPTWSASSDADMDTLNYTWQLATDSTFATVLLSVPTGMNSSVTLTLDAVRNLLEANNVTMGNSISLFHRANVTDSIVTVNGNFSNAIFNLGLVNTPPTATNIVVPANQDTVSVNGLPTATIDPAWTVSTDADSDTVNYVWQLSADSAFTNVLLNVPTSTDTTVSLTLDAVKTLLEANGLMRGQYISLYHRANASDSKETTYGNSAVATFELGIVNTPPTATIILVPAAGDTVNVAGLPTDTIVPAWSAATDTEMDSLMYTWELSASMTFATTLLSVNTMADTSVTLTNAAVEALLVSNGVTRGQSITLYHRVIARDGDSMTAGAGSVAVFTLGVVNTPPTATTILVPADGDTVNVNGLPTASITPTWSASSDADMDTLNYTYVLAADTSFTTVLLTVPAMTDTMVTLSVGDVKALLVANGIMEGGSITLYHRANTNDGDVVVNGNRAAATFNLGVVNTPPTATMITAPADSATVNVVGLPTTAFVPTWTSATDAEGDTIMYNWQLSVSSDFAASSVLADVAVGTDTLANLNLGAVDAILAGAGVNVGDTVRVYHRANATDGIAVTMGMSANVLLVRGVVNTPPTAADITVPFNATEITIQGDPTAPFTPRWTESTDADGDNVTYTWQLSTAADFSESAILVNVADLTTEQIDLTNRAVADVLDAAGVDVGVPITLYHRAQATDGKVTTNGVAKTVILTRGTLTNIGEELPVEFGLNQNYPNPFNPSTTISYQVAESRMVSVKIYDMLGREVANLVNTIQPAGTYNISFDAARLSTGIYIYRMVSGSFTQTRKMTLMK